MALHGLTLLDLTWRGLAWYGKAWIPLAWPRLVSFGLDGLGLDSAGLVWLDFACRRLVGLAWFVVFCFAGSLFVVLLVYFQ